MDQQSRHVPLSHQLHALARRQRAAATRRFFRLALRSAVQFLLRGTARPATTEPPTRATQTSEAMCSEVSRLP